MKEKYYKAKFCYNNTPKTYILSATHMAQAKERLIRILNLDYRNISDLILSEMK